MLSLIATSAPAFNPDYLDYPLGVVDHVNFEGISDLEGRWLRIAADWRHIEPEDGAFNWNSGFTIWLDSADAADQNVSAVVKIGQMWASGFEEPGDYAPSYPPVDLQTEFDPVYGHSRSYYDFIFNFVEHYRDRIDRITIENEANTLVFWAGTMDDYRRVLATAAKAVEDVAPEILVFDSGLGSGSWGVAIAQWMIESGDYTPEEVLEFANAYYEFNVYAPFEWDSYQDLVYWLYQPYVQENTKRVVYNVAMIGEYVDGMNLQFTESAWLLPIVTTWIDDVMAQHGHSVPLKVNNEGSNWPRGSEQREGHNLFKMIVGGTGWGVGQTLWFPYSNEQTSTVRRGLLDEDGALTQQAYAFRNIGQRLGVINSFVGHDTLLSSILRFQYQADGDSVPRLDAMWWDDGSHGTGSQEIEIVLPPETMSVRIYEYDGSISFDDATDTLVTTISDSPRFYEYVPEGTIGTPPEHFVLPILSQNAPNPFGGSTEIRFDLSGLVGMQSLPYRLEVFDVTGRRVRTLTAGRDAMGPQTVTWDGLDHSGNPLPAGGYWYRLVTPSGSVSKQLILIK